PSGSGMLVMTVIHVHPSRVAGSNGVRVTEQSKPRDQRRELMSGHPFAFAVRVALLGLVLSTAVADAQQPSATAMASARELVTIKGAKTIYEPLIGGIIEKAKGMFLQTNPMLSKDLNEVAGKLRADLGPRSAELVTETARIYA